MLHASLDLVVHARSADTAPLPQPADTVTLPHTWCCTRDAWNRGDCCSSAMSADILASRSAAGSCCHEYWVWPTGCCDGPLSTVLAPLHEYGVWPHGVSPVYQQPDDVNTDGVSSSGRWQDSSHRTSREWEVARKDEATPFVMPRGCTPWSRQARSSASASRIHRASHLASNRDFTPCSPRPPVPLPPPLPLPLPLSLPLPPPSFTPWLAWDPLLGRCFAISKATRSARSRSVSNSVLERRTHATSDLLRPGTSPGTLLELVPT